MNEIQNKIFEKVKNNWEERVGKGNVDENSLKDMIKLADTNSDGKKRVVVDGKTYLVPIEDILLIGINGSEVPEKYPLENESKDSKSSCETCTKCNDEELKELRKYKEYHSRKCRKSSSHTLSDWAKKRRYVEMKKHNYDLKKKVAKQDETIKLITRGLGKICNLKDENSIAERNFHDLESKNNKLKKDYSEMIDTCKNMKRALNRYEERLEKFKKWILENQFEEEHYSEQRPRPKIIKLLRADDVWFNFNELLVKGKGKNEN